MNKKLSKKIILLIVIVVIVLFIWFLGISPMIQFHKNEEKLTEAAKRYFELNKININIYKNAKKRNRRYK